MAANEWHKRCPVCNCERLRVLPAYARAKLVRCDCCAITFAGRQPTDDELAAHYRDYGHAWHDSPVLRRRYRELLDSFEPYRITNRLLDVGCGAGFFLDEARARGWETWGSEQSDRALALTRARGHEVVEAPVTLGTFEAGRFDVVTAFEVFEHVRDPMHEGAVLARVLRVGGLLYCTTPNFDSLSRRVLGARWNVIEYPEHLWYFTPRTLTGWLGQFGFGPERLWTSGVSLSRFRNSLPGPATSDSKIFDDAMVRDAIERSALLRTAKAVVNAGLAALGLGDTVKARFHRCDEHAGRRQPETSDAPTTRRAGD